MRSFIGTSPTCQAVGVTATTIQSKRRGATAMEYLMMLSLIIVVLLTAIGYFGNSTANIQQTNATAISNSMKKS